MLLPLPHRADGFVVEVDGLAVCRPDFGGGGLRLTSAERTASLGSVRARHDMPHPEPPTSATAQPVTQIKRPNRGELK